MPIKTASIFHERRFRKSPLEVGRPFADVRGVIKFELIAAAIDWVQQSASAQAEAEARLAAVTKQFQLQLDQLVGRVTRNAWRFVRFGYMRLAIGSSWSLQLKCRT